MAYASVAEGAIEVARALEVQQETPPREAIAHRFGSCVIRDVTNRAIANTPENNRTGRKGRSAVSLELAYTIADKAKAPLKKYEHDDTVVWNPTTGNGTILLPKNRKPYTKIPALEAPHGGAAFMDQPDNTATITFHPRTDYEPGTEMQVSITSSVETYTEGKDALDMYRTEVTTGCGSIVMGNVVNGIAEWRVDKTPTPQGPPIAKTEVL